MRKIGLMPAGYGDTCCLEVTSESQSVHVFRRNRAPDFHMKSSSVSTLTLKPNLWPGARAHDCNPSYLGGWDREDCSLRPANSSEDPHFQNNQSKISWRFGLKTKK
jgi:hypothetical protein